jgi:hypothetical protein
VASDHPLGWLLFRQARALITRTAEGLHRLVARRRFN